MRSPIPEKTVLAISHILEKVALKAAHSPLSVARNFADVFQKYTPRATIAAIAAAIHPMRG